MMEPMMIRRYILQTALCAGLIFVSSTFLVAQNQPATLNRQPAYAGSFYPATEQALESTLQELFRQASPVKLEGKIQSLIVPHAGYQYSGLVAASGYKSIPKDTEYQNVFIIASSHRDQFKGSSVYAVGNYITPLGEARINRVIANELIDNNKGISYYAKAHDREHSIEVQVPFIQYHFNNALPIIPIVMGSSSVSVARDLAAALMPYFTPDNLFIISSDFSHYPKYKDAIRIDKLTGNAILKKDPEYFYKIPQKNSNEPVQNLATSCCGWSSILTMLYMADRIEQIENDTN